MKEAMERRYQIGEVSEMTGVAVHVLRQWERKIPQLKPKRNRANRRYYLTKDIDLIRRVKFFIRHEKMTLDGARIRLAEELHGEGHPKTRQGVLDILDKLEHEVRTALDLLDS